MKFLADIEVEQGADTTFVDNAKALFGTSGDLEIYHDGSNSYIADVGTGDLTIRSSNDLRLQAASTEAYLTCNENGSVQIYYNNAEKFATSSAGINITGGWVTDGVSVATANIEHTDNSKALFGDGNDLQIYHDGSNSYISDTGTGSLKFTSSDIIMQTTGGNAIIAEANQGIKLYYNAVQKFATTSTGVTITGDLLINTTGGYFQVDVSDNSVKFADNTKAKFGTGSDLQIYHDGSHSYIKDSGTGVLKIQGSGLTVQNSSGSENIATFTENGSVGLYYDAIKRIETVSAGAKVSGNLEVTGAYYDTSNSPGTTDQILSSTVTGTAWIDPSAITAEAATLVVIACKNTSGATITKGTPVYQTGTVGATSTIEIAPADALISANKLPAIGLLQTDLNNNGFGNVVITGELTNFTTSPIDGVTPTTGDKVFVKSGGGLTLTKPTGEGNGIQNMGLVGKVSTGSSGSITVSSIMRTNDVPNLPEGRIWVGDGNTLVSDTVYIDEPNLRLGIGTTSPTEKLHVDGNARVTGAYYDSNNSPGTSGQVLSSTVTGADWIDSSAIPIDSRYVAITGDTMTGDLKLNDSVVAKFGTGDDLRIQHTGNQSYIQNYAGDLQIQNVAADKDILFRADDGSGVVTSYLVLDGSTTHAYFSNPGNVGIGTTNPVEKLYVNSTSGDARIGLNAPTGSDTEIKFSNNGIVQYSIGHDDATDNFVIGTANVDVPKVSIDKAGNVGIGTTNPSAFGKFAVQGVGNLLNLNATSGKVYQGFYENSSSRFYLNTLAGSDGLAFTDADGTSERMRIDSLGNVGIGTTGIDSILHIKDTGKLATLTIESDANMAGAVSFISPTSTDGGISMDSDGDFSISNSANTGFRLTGDTAPKLALGVNNTSPTQQLHLDANIRVEGAFYDSSGAFGSPGTSGQVLSSTGSGTAWVAASGGGGGTIGGTIAATQVAFGDATDSIDGSSKLTFTSVSDGLGYDKLRIGDGSTGSNQVLLDINTLGTSNTRGRLTLSDAGTLRGFLGITGGDEEVTLLSNDDLILSCGSGVTDIIKLNTNSSERLRINYSGDVGIGNTDPASKLSVAGGIQMANDTETSTTNSDKAGTLRYREVTNIGTPKASNSYIDMYMRTDDSTYEWVNIVTSNW